MKNRDNSRRDFLRQVSTLAAAAAVMPHWVHGESLSSSLVSPRVLGANEKVNLACVGIGHRGEQIIKAFAKTGLCNIVALCDIDMGARQTQSILKMYPNVPRFQDFRQMFDKMGGDIDAVCIGTPDHSHFPVTMLAMSLGKHVYVEKPMAHTFYECELMMEGEKKYKVVTQMGNQGHSEANYFQFKAWQDAGIIKNVRAVTAHMNSARRWHGWDAKMKTYLPGENIPDTLDWDSWLCGEQYHAYNKDYINGQWRCWYDFGMGALGDWGAHILDTVHEFCQLGLPTEINMLRADGHNPFFYPFSSTIQFRFPARGAMPPVDITWYDGLDNLPDIPEGYGSVELDPNIPAASNGKIRPARLNPGKIIYTDDLTFRGGSHGSTLSIIPEEKAKAMASRLPEVPKSPSNHFENFLLACKGQEKTRSPFSIAGPLSQFFCLGVIAQQLNAHLCFDPKLKLFTNSPVGNMLLRRGVPRKGWEEFYNL